ncbi:restriction endonuclease subunit S [uncultured Stenotrophomonas sp.]|uniref:restriction endonuclease subunit S n=1 Tax=uncultured Stenotrophomonas sp. TaxID=165438 RepID=UPI0025D5E53E|nr:restriction endonuclease subunit S [uncultured Stenotrophomonas sp.]
MNKHSTELLEKHFDTAFAAPDGVKKLRELILTLAMQGKLVPQDPNDQPASELLKEIEAEKQRLVKEGKLKKPKPLPSLTEEEKPYALPQGWEWVRLGNIGLINPRNNAADDMSAGFVPMPLIQEGYSELHSFEERPWGEIKRGYTHFADGDVGMAKITPCFENAKSCVFSNLPSGIGAGTTELHIFRNVFQAIDPRYLLFFLKNPKFISAAAARMTGSAGQKRVPTPLFAELELPLPPISEQYRIVAKIDELMARSNEMERLRTEQKETCLTVHAAAIKQLLNIAAPNQHQYAQAFLAEHFGELYNVKENVAELRKAIRQLAVMGKLVPPNPDDQPASELLKKINSVKRALEEKEGLRTSAAPFVSQSEETYGKPDGWSYCRLGNIGRFIDYRGKTPTKVEAGVPLITAKNVRFGYINREPKEYVTPEEYIRWMTRGFPRIGDILFTTEAPLGNVAIIDIEEEFALAQRVICLQFHVPEIAAWLKNFMMSDSFQDRLLSEATGMTAAGIKASKLKELAVPIPPLEEQYRITAKVDQLMAMCDSLDQRIDTATIKQAALLDAVMVQV